MPPLLPTGIYTIPEVGAVGETEEGLKKAGVAYVVGRADYDQNPRGKIIGDETGFLKLLFREPDLALVGAHVIGEQATELVHIGLMVMRAGGGLDLILHTCFNYPTLGGLFKQAAYAALLARRGKPATGNRG
jgi:NAD(P) transhydrogenase